MTRQERGPRGLWGTRGAGLGTLGFIFLGAPVAWSVHFLVIYFLVALFCTASIPGVGIAVAVTTLVFLVVSVASGVVAYRKWRAEYADRGWLGTLTSSDEWTPFLYLAGMLASAFFSALIVYESIAPIFVPPCPPIVP